MPNFTQQNIAPLQQAVPIVDPNTGKPTPQFIRYFQQLLYNAAQVSGNAVPNSRLINTPYGISGGGDLAADLALRTLSTPTVEASSSYTAQLSDSEGWIHFTSAAAVTLTLPPEATTAFEIGTFIAFSQGGAGKVTVTAGAGVTLEGEAVASYGQGAVCGVFKRAADTWFVFGSLDLTATGTSPSITKAQVAARVALRI